MTESGAWAVGAIGLSAAAAIDAPSINVWASDAVWIALIAMVGRVLVAWLQRGRPRRSSTTWSWPWGRTASGRRERSKPADRIA